MGFDYRKLPTLNKALVSQELIKERHGEIRLYSNENIFNKVVDDINDNFKFKPSAGWKDYL